jgi:uncharacterized protein (TIGR02099 family)
VKHLLTRSTKITLEILLFSVLLCAILLGFARSFFPHLDSYKPFFEEWASKTLHQPVKITHIQASWKGLHPLINMEAVDVLDATTHQSRLQIKRLQVGTNVTASLLQRRFVPSSITVVGAQIEAERVDAHTLVVNGISMPVTSDATPGIDINHMIDFLLAQGNVRLEEIEVHWKDQAGRLLHVTNLSAGLNHGPFKTQVIGAATLLTTEEPARFRFVINIYRGSHKLKCYLSVKNFDLTPWLKDLPFQDVRLNKGMLERLQLWAVWKNNHWQDAQALLQLKEAAVQTQLFNTPIALDEFTAKMVWERHPEGFNFAADQINLTLNQQHWPITQFSVQQAKVDSSTVQIATVDALDVGQLAQLASLYVSPSAQDPWKSDLHTIQPQGNLKNILVRRETPTTGDATISASVDFSALKTQALRNMPAIDGLEGKLKLTPTAGDLELNGRALGLNAPAWFRHPFSLEGYSGRFQWIKLADSWYVQGSDISITDDALGARADFNMSLPLAAGSADGSSAIKNTPYLQLFAGFSERDSSHLKNYVPVGLLSHHAALATWLTEAFVAGDTTNGQILLQGPLSHFPFDDHSGRFEAAVTVNNMQFNYKTGWPVIDDLNAQAFFDGRSLEIEAKPGAVILGIPTGPISAQIPDLAHAELDVQGNLAADMQDGMGFIAKSPLQKTIGEGLDNLALEGDMKLDLKLHIPIYHDAPPSTVEGNVVVAPGSKVDVPAWKINFTDFAGAFQFTEMGLFADKLSAKWLGQPVDIHIDTLKTDDTHTIQARLRGRANVADVVKKYELNFLTNKITGSTNYDALLKIARKEGHSQLWFGVDSDLQGLAIDLPDPLKKAVSEKLPTHVETKSIEKSSLVLGAQFAKRLSATLNFMQDAKKAWVFKAGDINFNAETQSAFGAALASARIQIQQQAAAWAVQINSPNVLGSLTIPSDFSSTIVGNFDRFRITPGGVSKTVGGVNPGDIPPLRLLFKNFYYGTKAFGSVFFLTSSHKNAMQIDQIKIDAPDAQILARGQWQQYGPNQEQQTTISGNLTSENIGAALKAWEVTSSVLGGNGSTAFAFSWPAAAYDFSAKQLNGRLSLAFGKGSIIDISDEKAAEMGIGKILNLLSLQSIPRRLTLDFSDLLQKGFVFNVMKGEFTLKNGQAMTDNAYLDGPIAKVEVKGGIGMGDKDYDLLMTTTPYVTSSLPIAATIVGGPIAGAATWLGSKVFSGVVDSITKHTYKVTGSWDKPVIETAR